MGPLGRLKAAGRKAYAEAKANQEEREPAKRSSSRGPKDSTLLKVYDYLDKKHNKVLPYVQKPSHVPSSFGTDCYRRIYYSYFRLEKETKVDEKSARIFETGNAYEAMVMDWLKGIGEHIPYRNKSDGQIPKSKDGSGKPDPQFPISVPEWRINKGFIDNVALIDGELWLYEIKSKNSFAFGKLQEPDWDHQVQITPYFKAVNNALNNGDYAHIPELEGIKAVTGVKVIYINKDTSDVKLYALREQDMGALTKMVSQKVEKSNEYIDTKTLPPKNESNCKWCPFQGKCSKDFNIS
jgi:hypothetical protein